MWLTRIKIYAKIMHVARKRERENIMIQIKKRTFFSCVLDDVYKEYKIDTNAYLAFETKLNAIKENKFLGSIDEQKFLEKNISELESIKNEMATPEGILSLRKSCEDTDKKDILEIIQYLTNECFTESFCLNEEEVAGYLAALTRKFGSSNKQVLACTKLCEVGYDNTKFILEEEKVRKSETKIGEEFEIPAVVKIRRKIS